LRKLSQQEPCKHKHADAIGVGASTYVVAACAQGSTEQHHQPGCKECDEIVFLLHNLDFEKFDAANILQFLVISKLFKKNFSAVSHLKISGN
jgi:hypothetical protein